MRLIKMSGLAVVATMALAVIGASSATAGSTLLCTKNTVSLTPTAAECAAPTAVHYVSVGKVTLLNNVFNLECNALLTGTVLSKLVTNGPISISVAAAGLGYSSCSGFCAWAALEGGTVLILKTGVELATVTGDGFRVRLNCPLFDCDYNWAGLAGHGLAQGSEGKSHVTYQNAATNLLTDLASPFGSCPTGTFLDALFQTLTPIYIRS